MVIILYPQGDKQLVEIFRTSRFTNERAETRVRGDGRLR
jgi:hypothetical protein